MSLLVIASHVAAKTYKDALSAVCIAIHDTETKIDNCRRNILELHGMTNIIPTCQWFEMMEKLVSTMKYLARYHADLDVLFFRLVSNPDDKDFWSKVTF